MEYSESSYRYLHPLCTNDVDIVSLLTMGTICKLIPFVRRDSGDREAGFMINPALASCRFEFGTVKIISSNSITNVTSKCFNLLHTVKAGPQQNVFYKNILFISYYNSIVSFFYYRWR